MRDLTGDDVRKKRALQKIMLEQFEKHGFEEVMTPAMEYYQTYSEAFDSLQDREMVKLFDENSDILALRLDMTVPIARLAAAKYQDVSHPLRFSYCSNVYKMRKSFAGKRSEVMDCGVELIGGDDFSDLEVLVTALDTLDALNLGEYTFEIGEVNFFSAAADAIFSSAEEKAVLADLINRKSMVELGEFLENSGLDAAICEFFLVLPMLNGEKEILEQARQFAFLPELHQILDRLEAICIALEELGYGRQIRFDLGKIPYLNYYTGLIFEAFASGVGTSILSGGRYDSLLGKFGLPANARGFSLKLDYLIDLIETPAKKPVWTIHYPASRWKEAFALAAEIQKSEPAVLSLWERDEIVKELDVCL